MSVTVTSDDLVHLAKILKEEEDGKKLRKELSAALRKASEPARDAARAAILSMDSGGLGREGESLRQAIADRITTEARLSGQSTGARVKARKLKTGFINAPKRTSANKFRHPVFRRFTRNGDLINVWVDQVGKPRWFPDAMKSKAEEWRKGVLEAMNSMAERIARKG
jgi:hypothetical protein